MHKLVQKQEKGRGDFMHVHGKGLAMISIVILLFATYFPTTATTQTIDVSARSAILMDEITGRVIYALMHTRKAELLALLRL